MNESLDRTDRITTDEEQISTADLAGAGREDRHEDRHATIEGTPVEVVRSPREREDRATEDGSAVPVPVHTSVAQSTAPGSAAAAAPAREPATRSDENVSPLFSGDEAGKLRARWDAIQVGFVDEPRKSVEEADSLVALAMKRLAEQFAEERSSLEHQWDRGSDVSTEDLRVALRRYRSFFSRLLNV